MLSKKHENELRKRLHITVMALDEACGGDWDNKVLPLLKKHGEPFLNGKITDKKLNKLCKKEPYIALYRKALNIACRQVLFADRLKGNLDDEQFRTETGKLEKLYLEFARQRLYFERWE